ncbi:ParA family protein [Aliarcobacter cibarius]|uniref:ParA family protein n=1 Tax=Aliarcobacter cibarius TaxID=255507 RepID=A0ABY2V4P4_9BACT|nr:ParA family protein [Aliarcobacter cibarius]TLS99922.1 ParA family protein [Aliarcobacter cibarius]TLT00331.1 ParA family protein [Aliarcobacter cibarius]
MKNKSITVCHTKGGVGKTTILINLAIYLVNKGFVVRVADCDPNKVSTFISKVRAKNKELKNFEVKSINSVQELENYYNTPFYGITLIDTAGVDNILTRKALELGNLCIVPVAASITEVIGLKTFEAIVKSINIDKSKIKILLNQVHIRAEKFSSFEDQLKTEFEFFKSTLPQLNDFKKSLSSGKSVLEQYKKDELCSAGKRFEIFAKEIEEMIK